MFATLLLHLGVHSAVAEPFARVGEPLADATVVEVLSHAEFERLTLQLADGRLLVTEITGRIRGASGACEHHELLVQPRWDLLGEVVEVEDQPPAILALCERVAERGDDSPLADAPIVRRHAEPPPPELPEGAFRAFPPSPLPLRWLHGVLAALGAALLLAGPRLRAAWRALSPAERRDLPGLLLLAGAARVGLAPQGLSNWDGFDRIVLAWGQGEQVHPMYGDGYAALMTLGWPFAPFHATLVFLANGSLAVASVGLAWAIGRAVAPGSSARLAGLVAGAGLALWPVHLRLSVTETMHVSLLAFELLALAAGLGALRLQSKPLAVAAGLAAGFAAHLRPEAMLMPAAVLAIALGARDRRGRLTLGLAAAVALATALPRWLELPDLVQRSRTAGAARLLEAHTWRQLLTPRWGPLDDRVPFPWIGLHVRLTSPLWLGLIGVGVLRAERRTLAWSGAWAVLVLGPILGKNWPSTDAMRLQLPGLTPSLVWLALGAVAIVRLPRLAPLMGRPWAAVAAMALASLPHLGTVQERWVPARDHAFAVAHLPELPDRALVLIPDHALRVDDALGAHAQLLGWRSARTGAVMGLGTWLDQHPAWPGPVYALQNHLCTLALPETSPGAARSARCDELVTRCGLETVARASFPAQGDGYLSWREDPVEVRLSRVTGCMSDPAR